MMLSDLNQSGAVFVMLNDVDHSVAGFCDAE